MQLRHPPARARNSARPRSDFAAFATWLLMGSSKAARLAEEKDGPDEFAPWGADTPGPYHPTRDAARRRQGRLGGRCGRRLSGAIRHPRWSGRSFDPFRFAADNCLFWAVLMPITGHFVPRSVDFENDDSAQRVATIFDALVEESQ